MIVKCSQQGCGCQKGRKDCSNREGGGPVVHFMAARRAVIIWALDGDRLCHVHDVPAAFTSGGLCDCNGIAEHLAQVLWAEVGHFAVPMQRGMSGRGGSCDSGGGEWVRIRRSHPTCNA